MIELKPRLKELAVVLGILLAALFVKGVIDNLPQHVPDNVVRMPSPYRPVTGTSITAYWMDSHRLIFHGADPSSGIGGIFTWDIRSGEVTTYRVPAGNLCYHEGQISYIVSRDENGWLPLDERKLFAGRMGEEVEVDLKGLEGISRLTCEVAPVRLEREGRKYIPLLPGDGYYSSGGSGMWIFDRDLERVGRVTPDNLVVYQYVPWERAYVFTPDRETIDKGLSDHRVYRPGEGLAMHRGVLPSLRGRFIHTRDKLMMRVTQAPGLGAIGKSGLYLVDEASGEATRIRAGLIYGHRGPTRGVSPDGCRLAYAYAEDFYKSSRRGGFEDFLEVMDLCD